MFNQELLTCREVIDAFCGDIWPNQELHSLDVNPIKQVCCAVMQSMPVVPGMSCGDYQGLM